jgi:putative exporter of polyketide antibiotics
LGAAVTPGGFIAIMNMLYAVVLAGYAIACIHGDYDDETSNRLDLPYSNPVTRTGWAGSTVVTVTGALIVLTMALGLATWAGSAMASAGLSAGDSLAAAANVLPAASVFLGIAMLLHGVRPSWAAGVTGVLAIGLYMVELIGPGMSWPN